MRELLITVNNTKIIVQTARLMDNAFTRTNIQNLLFELNAEAFPLQDKTRDDRLLIKVNDKDYTVCIGTSHPPVEFVLYQCATDARLPIPTWLAAAQHSAIVVEGSGKPSFANSPVAIKNRKSRFTIFT